VTGNGDDQGRAGARVHPGLLHQEKGLPRHTQVPVLPTHREYRYLFLNTSTATGTAFYGFNFVHLVTGNGLKKGLKNANKSLWK